MVDRLTPKTIVGLWFVVVVAALAIGAVLGVRPGLITSLLIAGAAFAPPTMVLFVWKDSAPMTVAELLHDVEHRG